MEQPVRHKRPAGLLGVLSRLLAGYLTGPSRASYTNVPTEIESLAKAVRPGDVILVEGKQRISTAIKYLTQSTWSHAALCITRLDDNSEGTPHFIEADAVEGVRKVGVEEFAGHHIRICRPIGITDREIDQMVMSACKRLGHQYDMRNVLDLARYLFPTPPVPRSWRRRMIALGSGEPTQAICSTLVAQAFQAIHYPILPELTQEMIEDPDCRKCVRELLHIRHHSLFTPRDFDISPYFQIIKPTIDSGFDYHRLKWSD